MIASLIESKVRCARVFTGNPEEHDSDAPRYPVSAGLLVAPRSPLLLAPPSRRKTLLLVSRDAVLATALRHLASLDDLAFQQITDAGDLLRLMAANHTTAVFVDLDLPELEGWKAAEKFLDREQGPPLFLCTGHAGHFDLGQAVRAGLILDKSVNPAVLCGELSDLLANLDTDPQPSRARQRLLVRWLRPNDWTVPSVHRDWGINE